MSLSKLHLLKCDKTLRNVPEPVSQSSAAATHLTLLGENALPRARPRGQERRGGPAAQNTRGPCSSPSGDAVPCPPVLSGPEQTAPSSGRRAARSERLGGLSGVGPGNARDGLGAPAELPGTGARRQRRSASLPAPPAGSPRRSRPDPSPPGLRAPGAPGAHRGAAPRSPERRRGSRTGQPGPRSARGAPKAPQPEPGEQGRRAGRGYLEAPWAARRGQAGGRRGLRRRADARCPPHAAMAPPSRSAPSLARTKFAARQLRASPGGRTQRPAAGAEQHGRPAPVRCDAMRCGAVRGSSRSQRCPGLGAILHYSLPSPRSPLRAS